MFSAFTDTEGHGIRPDNHGVDLSALAGVALKLVEEGVEERHDQVH